MRFDSSASLANHVKKVIVKYQLWFSLVLHRLLIWQLEAARAEANGTWQQTIRAECQFQLLRSQVISLER